MTIFDTLKSVGGLFFPPLAVYNTFSNLTKTQEERVEDIQYDLNTKSWYEQYGLFVSEAEKEFQKSQDVETTAKELIQQHDSTEKTVSMSGLPMSSFENTAIIKSPNYQTLGLIAGGALLLYVALK